MPLSARLFEGISGWVNISAGSRIGMPFSVVQLQPGLDKVYGLDVTMVAVGEYDTGLDHISITRALRFASGAATPPADTPEACAPGTEYAGRLEGCIACSPGSYNPGWDARCFRCSPGTVTPNNASTQCKQCLSGFFASAGTHCCHCPPAPIR